MGALDAFASTWSDARATFGQGIPQQGADFDQSSQLQQAQSQVRAAAPGSRWTGGAADAYAAANSAQGRTLGQMAGLDQRLGAEVDRSAAVITAGRQNLDSVKQWVNNAAASVPQGTDRDQMLTQIARKGIGDVADVVRQTNSDLTGIGARIRTIGDEYRSLGGPKRGGGPGDQEPGNQDPKKDKKESPNKYEQALRDAGLLTGPSPQGYYKQWLENAERHNVPPEEIVAIAREQHITPDSFKVLEKMEEVKDPDGKSFFLVPKGTAPWDMQKAVLMTYILNAGTDYGAAPGTKDFAETPYTAAEVQRIADRQRANDWSYAGGWAIEHTGGSLVTTPNGMLMGLGGKVQDTMSCQGGTTYGDIFMVNIDHASDPAEQLRNVVRSGHAWSDYNGKPLENQNLDLDRLLHHEERHSQQYAKLGPVALGVAYGEEQLRTKIFGGDNWFEKDAGLHDGGYQ